jgi:alpha,alpha-trehalase
LVRYATGGELPGMLPRLPDEELKVTNSVKDTGHVSGCKLSFSLPLYSHEYPCKMFEKFSNLDVASAGGGGEYVVQVSSFFSLP